MTVRQVRTKNNAYTTVKYDSAGNILTPKRRKQLKGLAKKNNKDRKWVKIVSKYEGECCVCYNKILTDTEVLWNKGNKKIRHLPCTFKAKITKKIINKKQRKKQYKKFSLEQRRKSRISTENNGLPIVPTSLSIEEDEWIKSWKENHEK